MPGLGDSGEFPLAAWLPARYTRDVDETLPKQHDPSKPVSTRDELDELLRAGLESGAPRPMTDDDWERLRRRALAGTELRQSG